LLSVDAMRLHIGAGVLLAGLFSFVPSARADFDVERGVARIDAKIGLGFETDLGARTRAAAIGDATSLPSITPARSEWRVGGGIEGEHALRVPAGTAIVAGDLATFAALHGSRVELRFWARADGARPSGRLVFAAKDVEGIDLLYPSGLVDALETGRATDDGWVEYSTGPVDGALGARTRLAAIVLEAEADPLALGSKHGAFLVDAVELVDRGPLTARAKSCTLATEDATCGADGACVEGACFDSALVWGALPSVEQRREIVRRQEHVFERLTSDRYGASRTATHFTAPANAAAETATTPRAFWQPFQRGAALVRGAHSRAAGPARYSRLSWAAMTYGRSQWNELLACFGLVERDIAGGGRGFAVFAAAPSSTLRTGDIVEKIDGEDPRAWLARAVPFAPLSSDPDVDDAYQGSVLQSLVPALAQTLEITRCASASSCTGSNATKVVIDLALARASALSLPWQTQPACSVRFTLPVEVPAGADPNAYEAAFESVDTEGVVNVLTNGEPPGPDLAAVVNKAFDRGAAKMLVDKRRGDGGGGDSLQVWGERVRQDPTFRTFDAGRWSFDAIDPPPAVFAELAGCDDRGFNPVRACWAMSAWWANVPAATAKPRPSKIAWLNLVDGSASDYASAYAKGATGVRIFAPNRSMGLFGGLHHLPRFASGLSDPYAQRSDARIGSTWEEVTAAKWHSGRGIDPDEVVVQTASDLLAGRDTMLERARAWLREND
jgi:hypothetical protein